MQFVSHISHIMHNRNLQVQQNWNWGIIGYSSFLSSYFTSLQLFGTKNRYILSPYKLYLNPAQRLKKSRPCGRLTYGMLFEKKHGHKM